MANGADWRNLQQTHTNGVQTNARNEEEGQNPRGKKFENLQSNLFDTEEGNQRPVYNPEVEKAAFGTDANWSA